MVQLILQILKFVAKAYGFAADEGRKIQHAKGLEAKVNVLNAEIDRGNKTELILKNTMRQDEDDLPFFDYSEYRTK